MDREEADPTRFANQLNTISGTPVLNRDPFEPFPGIKPRRHTPVENHVVPGAGRNALLTTSFAY